MVRHRRGGTTQSANFCGPPQVLFIFRHSLNMSHIYSYLKSTSKCRYICKYLHSSTNWKFITKIDQVYLLFFFETEIHIFDVNYVVTYNIHLTQSTIFFKLQKNLNNFQGGVFLLALHKQ